MESKKKQIADCDDIDYESASGLYSMKAKSPNAYFWVVLLLVQGGLLVCLACLLSASSGYNGALPQAMRDDSSWGANVTIDGHTMPVISWFDDKLEANNIKSNLHTLTEKPHIAGSEENHQLAVLIYNQWSMFNFDKVELVNYSVLLSYPNSSDPNVLQLLNSKGDLLYNAHSKQEPPLTPGEDDPNVAPPFNAYSGSGEAKGPLVYVNYGTIYDFLYLTQNLSLNLSSHLCMARYGQIFRGDKARLAQRYGCSGLLIYSDPQDYAPHGVPVYPNGPSLPPGGVQRGTLKILPGDPLTPDVPAIEGMYRRPYSEVVDEELVPKIPVQPVSYGDAIHFMSQLEDFTPPSSWVGQLPGITYKIMQNSKNTNVTRLQVNNYQEQKTIYNVIATIYGQVEPDRQVILGNHRDAWVFGAVDPNSATAVLMEMARNLDVLRKNNWRPGRTLVLCSWDAEEPMLVGSTEWVQDKGKLLGANTLAYINVDLSVEGNMYVKAQASPLLYKTLWRAASLVKCPNTTFNTVYDQWLDFISKKYNGTTRPYIFDLSSGTDYTAFLQEHGISCISMAYENTTDYAVYHSVHDNFYWMSHFGDPDFSYHVAMGLVWMKTAVLLSTTPLPPYDPRHFGQRIREIYNNLESHYGDPLKEQNISLSYLNASVSAFSDSCVKLWEEVQRVTQNGPPSENIVRIIIDKYMNMERAFIRPEGLPGRPYFKHVVFAPSSVNSYGSSLFPGISDTVFSAIQSGKEEDWNKVRIQIDIVRNHMRYAALIADDPSLENM